MWVALSVSTELLWLKKTFQHWFWKRSSKRTFTKHLLFEMSTAWSSLCLVDFDHPGLIKESYLDTGLFILVL